MSQAQFMIFRRLWINLGAVFVPSLLVCIIGEGIVGVEGATAMDNIISVNVSSSPKPNFIHGPVPAIITINNLSTSNVQIVLPYPNPNNLGFSCKSTDFAKQKVVERERIELSVPITIPPGSSHKTTYYLNRYLRFQKPGEAQVAYRLSTLVRPASGTSQTSRQNVLTEGEFTVQLSQGSEAQLRAELAEYSEKLRSSVQRVKMEAAEALGFLDTPLSIDYVVPMLSIADLEILGIRALGRHPPSKVHDLIVGMLSHKDSAVVAASLNEIDRYGVLIPRSKVQNLLVSDNANTRWIALQWLAARPDKEDLQLVLPLLKDENAEVQKQARTYSEVLRRM